MVLPRIQGFSKAFGEGNSNLDVVWFQDPGRYWSFYQVGMLFLLDSRNGGGLAATTGIRRVAGVGRDGSSNGFGCRLSRFSRESPAEASSFVSVVFVRLAAAVRLIGGDLETRSL
nr:hypothetical protein Iba_chr12dCG2620 [Ipomoea batatas]